MIHLKLICMASGEHFHAENNSQFIRHNTPHFQFLTKVDPINSKCFKLCQNTPELG